MDTNTTLGAIEITNVPAKVSVNFADLKQELADYLEGFKGVVITAETVQEGKKLIEKVNTTRKELEKRRKEEVAKASEPIKLFDAQMKELAKLCDQVLDEYRTQVDKFETERKQQILEDLKTLRAQLWDERNVAEEYRRARCEDLALLGAVTQKGNFTSKTINEVTRRVEADKSMQNQTELRLARLEADSYKAGLAAPLNRHHVEHFLFDTDDDYQRKLETLFQSEMDREKQAVERRRAEFTKEQDLVEQALAEKRPAPQTAANTVKHSAPEGREALTVNCTFEISVGPNVTNEAVRAKIRERLEAAGFTTLSNIEIYRKQEAA